MKNNLIKLFILSFCLSFGIKISAQELKGIYYGEFPTAISYLDTTNVDTTGMYFLPINDSIKLELDDRFKLSYFKYEPCIRKGNRFCSGNYKRKGDTLFLQSDYKSDDFYKIDHSNTTHINKDSTLLIINAEHWKTAGCLLKWHNVNIVTDNGFTKSFKIPDSLFINNQTKTIKISMHCPTSMDWLIDLRNKKKDNRVKLNLLCGLDNENLSVDNMKFLVKNDTIQMLSDFYFLDIKKNVFIKDE